MAKIASMRLPGNQLPGRTRKAPILPSGFKSRVLNVAFYTICNKPISVNPLNWF